jgi:hypothetical protein
VPSPLLFVDFEEWPGVTSLLGRGLALFACFLTDDAKVVLESMLEASGLSNGKTEAPCHVVLVASTSSGGDKLVLCSLEYVTKKCRFCATIHKQMAIVNRVENDF